MDFGMKQTLDFGDLCVVKGYGNQVWEVISYSRTQYFELESTSETIVYDLINIHTDEWTLGMQEDTQIVCKAKYAYDYINELDSQGLPPARKRGDVTMNNREGREPYVYPDTLDGLLMELSDLNCTKEELEKKKVPVDANILDKIEFVKEQLLEKRASQED